MTSSYNPICQTDLSSSGLDYNPEYTGRRFSQSPVNCLSGCVLFCNNRRLSYCPLFSCLRRPSHPMLFERKLRMPDIERSDDGWVGRISVTGKCEDPSIQCQLVDQLSCPSFIHSPHSTKKTFRVFI